MFHTVRSEDGLAPGKGLKNKATSHLQSFMFLLQSWRNEPVLLLKTNSDFWLWNSDFFFKEPACIFLGNDAINVSMRCGNQDS